jgi:hypothetical protein
MALAPRDPCGPLEAFVTASSGPLHRVSIATGGTGLTVSACKDAHIPAEDVMQMRPGALKTPLATIGRAEAVRRPIMRHRTPGNAASTAREHPIEHLAFGRGCGSTARLCLRKQWLKHLASVMVSTTPNSLLHRAKEPARMW